jgi:hypothetical protein
LQALDIRFLRKVQVAAVGLALAGECLFQILLGLGILRERHRSLHPVHDGRHRKKRDPAHDADMDRNVRLRVNSLE